MLARSSLLLLAILVLAGPVHAQHGAAAPLTQRTPPREAAQFEFLVGQWELDARPRASGLAARLHGAPRLVGSWKAWRALDGFGITDELRLTDESGNPRVLTHTVRYYSVTDRRWSTSSLDVYRGIFTSANAEWRDGRMLVSSRGTDAEGRAYLSRTRFYEISGSGFRVQIDRSYDDGRSWTEGVLRIQAKRVSSTAAR